MSTIGLRFGRSKPIELGKSRFVSDMGQTMNVLGQNFIASSNLRSVWSGLPVISIRASRLNVPVIVGSPHKSDYRFGIYIKFGII